MRSSVSRRSQAPHRLGGIDHRHAALLRRQIVRCGGREIKTMGEGFLATFDGRARAVRRAAAIRDARGSWA